MLLRTDPRVFRTPVEVERHLIQNIHTLFKLYYAPGKFRMNLTAVYNDMKLYMYSVLPSDPMVTALKPQLSQVAVIDLIDRCCNFSTPINYAEFLKIEEGSKI